MINDRIKDRIGNKSTGREVSAEKSIRQKLGKTVALIFHFLYTITECKIYEKEWHYGTGWYCDGQRFGYARYE